MHVLFILTILIINFFSEMIVKLLHIHRLRSIPSPPKSLKIVRCKLEVLRDIGVVRKKSREGQNFLNSDSYSLGTVDLQCTKE